jgi:hypothetical protein
MENHAMPLEERALTTSLSPADDEARIRRVMSSLEEENRTLKDLVVKLSNAIVRHVVDRKE